MTIVRQILTAAVFLCISVAVLFQTDCRRRTDATFEEINSHRNLGLAYLEENRLKEARAEFQALIGLAPEEPLGYANLALTHLRIGNFKEAESQFRQALKKTNDPDVLLILAEIYEKGGKPDLALNVLRESVKKNPVHYRSQYRISQLLIRSGEPGADVALRKVLEAQPGNITAKLQLIEVLLRESKGEQAALQLDEARAQIFELSGEQEEYFRKAFQLAQQSKSKEALPAAIAFHNLVKPSALYQASVIDLVGPGGPFIGFPVLHFSEKTKILQATTTEQKIQFTDVTTQFVDASSLTLGDFDGDEDPDLYVGGALYSNDNGKFLDVSQPAGVKKSKMETAAMFFDSNNDGHLDLLTISSDGHFLYQNAGDGKFHPPVRAFAVPASSSLIMDLDNDGDLDPVLIGQQGNYAFRNNSDGTFLDITSKAGLSAAGSDAAFADFDEDGDLDIVVANAQGKNLLYSNLRQGRFEQVVAPLSQNSLAVTIGDYDNDGFLDIFFAGKKSGLFRNGGNGSFEPESVTAWPAASDAQFFDFDNDGFLDLLIAGKETHLFRNNGNRKFVAQALLPSGLQPVRQVAVSDYDRDGDIDIFLLSSNGKVRLLKNDGGNANRWLNVRLKALGAGSGKNNRFGIGARVELKAGNSYQARVVDQPFVHFGLGARDKADVLRVVWTNGVPQNHFQPASNQMIVETQVLKGSCPFLYAWNGEEYAFVTDIMWKSALGMPVGSKGEETIYAFPNSSDEYLKISGSALRAKDGRYSIQITEELWETSYLDQSALVVLDHPEGSHLYIDERFVTPPYPPLKIYSVRQEHPPLSAIDENGRDVLALLRYKDDRFITGFVSGPYQGTAELHDLVLDLGKHSTGSKIVLFLNGWVFPGDASINFAMTQSEKTKSVPPYLEVADGSGGWKTAIPNLSFPMGKNKMVIADLTGKFLTEDHHVRIRTNMQIYWDYIFFTKNEKLAELRKTRVKPVSADLHYRGFSRMYRKGFYGPHWFDYRQVTTKPQWRDLIGLYTRYGDVTPLLHASDNKYVIMNAGDELSIAFDASHAPDLRHGWTRDFLLYSDGWIKDGDLNTAHSKTVEPLPFHGMSRYPYGKDEAYPSELGQYLREYNTRAVRN